MTPSVFRMDAQALADEAAGQAALDLDRDLARAA
jgi:hypothetical protein